MLQRNGFEQERGAVPADHSLAHRASAGGVGVWSEGISDLGQVGLDSVVLPHFGVESNLAADRWYALYVRSRHEKTVENSLRLKGYSVFSPSYRTTRKRVDRIAEIEVALFPGYVFCQFDTNKRLPILMTPGVVGSGGAWQSGGARG